MFSITMLDENFKPIYIVNSYDDLLWMERYLTVGSFKLILSHISNKMKGDKVTYNGKKYISAVDGNVHAPGIVAGNWQEV